MKRHDFIFNSTEHRYLAYHYDKLNKQNFKALSSDERSRVWQYRKRGCNNLDNCDSMKLAYYFPELTDILALPVIDIADTNVINNLKSVLLSLGLNEQQAALIHLALLSCPAQQSYRYEYDDIRIVANNDILVISNFKEKRIITIFRIMEYAASINAKITNIMQKQIQDARNNIGDNTIWEEHARVVLNLLNGGTEI